MKTMKKIFSFITVIIGVVVIILGATLIKGPEKQPDISFKVDNHFIDMASFGADFYTYIYEACYSIADGTDDVQRGLSAVVDAQNNTNTEINNLAASVHKVGGFIVISIGLAILVYGLHQTAAAFLAAKPNKHHDNSTGEEQTEHTEEYNPDEEQAESCSM